MAQQNFLFSVASVEHLPGRVRQELRRQPEQVVHGIFVCPPQQYPTIHVGWLGDLPFRWRATPQRIVLWGDHAITVIGVEHETLTTTNIPFDSLVFVDLVVVLLYAYLQFTWVCGDRVETIKIEFNSVGERIVRREVDGLRALMAANAHRTDLNRKLLPVQFPDLPLKYLNYLRHGMFPGEHPLKIVYQPAIRLAQRWIQPYISPNRALAVTEHYLIALEDERYSAQPDYAVVMKFIPLWQIRDVGLEPGDPVAYLNLAVGTSDASETVRYPLEPAAARDLGEALGVVRTEPPSLEMTYA